MKKIIMLKVFISIVFSSCLLFTYGQVNGYKNIKSVPQYVQRYDALNGNARIKKQYNFVDVTNYLPRGYVTNGTVDYTSYIQAVLNSNKFVLMPNFPVMVNDKGLDIQSNQIVLFQTKSKIKLGASNKANYEIIRIKYKKNVQIFSPVIEGDRDIHLNNKGEWGMGIAIISSSNVFINDLNISKCWGDGLYIGQNGVVNSNIILKYGIIDNNRRNGISVISANGLEISNFIVSNSIGTNPQAGLDFEPNSIKEDLKSIKILNSYFFNNKRYGIVINSSQISDSVKSIDLEFNNVMCSNTESGFAYTSKKTLKNRSSLLQGSVTYINADVSNTTIPFKMIGRANSDQVNIKVQSPNSKKFNMVNDKRVKISK
ncbi:hypothetical protein D3C73_455520 [compost metagenome]